MDFISTLPLLQIHITAVFITLMLVGIADTHGVLWILGKMQTLPITRMRFFHRTIWVGLLTVITAGFFMFIGYSEYLLTHPAFIFKILFVSMLLINAFIIGKHLMIATVKPFVALSSTEKKVLLISGAASTLGWVGAFICAQLL